MKETEEETRTHECYRPGADVTTQYDHAATAANYREFCGDINPNWLSFLDTLRELRVISTKVGYSNFFVSIFV